MTAIKKPRTYTSETKQTEKYPFRHPLDTGDKGLPVMWVQSKLMKHGFYEGDITGRYLRDTALAVRAFQDSNGLAVTGIVDRKTWNLL